MFYKRQNSLSRYFASEGKAKYLLSRYFASGDNIDKTATC